MKRILFSLAFLGVVFSISHFFFDATYLYYEIWWLDIPMHILGGLGVGSLVYSMLTYKKIQISYTKLVIGFLIVACMWEFYEYIFNHNLYETASDYLDTVKDTINGLIGVTVTYFFIKKD